MGNERLTAKGRAGQARVDAREAKKKIKDVGHDIGQPCPRPSQIQMRVGPPRYGAAPHAVRPATPPLE